MCTRSFASATLFIFYLLGFLSWACHFANSRPTNLPMEDRYEQWIAQHGRVYKDDSEKARRFNIFKANVEYIDSVNAKRDRMYKLAANQFADLTNDEFSSSLNGFIEQHPLLRTVESFRYSNVTEVPDVLDWRSLGAVTPIKNQGQCGMYKLLIYYVYL